MRTGFLAAAAALWLAFVASLATGALGGRLQGGGGLIVALVWHGLVGYSVARAFTAADEAAPSDRFETARTAALATAVSLALGYGAGLVLAG